MSELRGGAQKRRTAIILGACVALLLPLFFMIVGSLRAPGLPPPDGVEWLPDPVTWSNYSLVENFIPLGQMVRNSLVVVALAVPLTVLVASLAGFAIVAARPRTRRVLVGLSLVALMVPAAALWVPRFALFKWLGLIDSFVPLVAPALMATSPFYVLLFALAYWRVPRNLFDAARLDGLTPLQVWRRVALPLSKPTVFAVAVLAFAVHWSSFVEPLLYLSSPDRFTVPLGLRALQTLEPANHPILLAASVLVTIPPVIAFLLAQRAFFSKTLEV
jgi:multiple sugar transport system permease protein